MDQNAYWDGLGNEMMGAGYVDDHGVACLHQRVGEEVGENASHLDVVAPTLTSGLLEHVKRLTLHIMRYKMSLAKRRDGKMENNMKTMEMI